MFGACMRLPIYSHVPVKLTYSISNNNGSSIFRDTVGSDEEEYNYSSGGTVVVKHKNDVVFSIAGLVNNAELVVEFESPVLAEYFAQISWGNCNVRSCWGKVWVYSDENPMVCMNQEKHSKYGCPYVFHQMYRYRCDTRSASGLMRIKRIVMWSNCPWGYDFELNLRILGVYDGLSISPKYSEYFDYPAKYYFSEPEVTAVCCNASESVEFGSVRQMGAKDPFNFNSRGAVLRAYNGKYGLSVLISYGGGRNESRADFDKLYEVLSYLNMQYMISRDAYGGWGHIYYKLPNSPIYYTAKFFNFAYNGSVPCRVGARTGSVRVVSSLPNPSTLTVDGVVYAF